MVEPHEFRKEPRTHSEAEFSLPWVVACALIDRELSPSHFSERALADQRYRELAKRVDTAMDVASEGAFVELELAGGRQVRSRTILDAKGHPDNPLSTAEMVARIRACIASAPVPLSKERTELALDLLLRLEDTSDATEVVRLLAPPALATS
jgi:2-methylcitrate dehydratase PrpD